MQPIDVVQELIESLYKYTPADDQQELIGRGRLAFAQLLKMKEAVRLDAPYPCPLCLFQRRVFPGQLTIQMCRETGEFGEVLSLWPEFYGSCQDEPLDPENGRIFQIIYEPLNHADRLTTQVREGEFSGHIEWLMGMRKQRRETLQMLGISVEERW